jgi:hypothetical protein
MGYAHYWSQKKLSDGDMGKIARALKAIIGIADVDIAGWDGNGKAEFDGDRIAFNGRGDDQYETMAITPEPASFLFCKTGRRPYDVVVTALLTYCAAEHGFNVRSDGDAKDWEAGNRLLTMALGETYPNPLAQAMQSREAY